MSQISVNKASDFRRLTTNIAGQLLTDWVGEDRAKEAVGRISSSLAASAAASRNPTDFYECTPQSVATVVAVSALTGIMPGTGACALAYAIPRRPRKGEPPQLQYQLSHRGVNSLARRCGQTIIPIPIGHGDQLQTLDSGEVKVANRDIDNPPDTFEDLRGVVIAVKEIDSGHVTFCGFVPKSIIEKRRAMSDSWKYDVQKGYSYSPWTNWPIEQAMKTAMHYAASRGWCVIDDTAAVKALSLDSVADVIDQSPPSVLIEAYPAGSKADRVAAQLAGDDDEQTDASEPPEVPVATAYDHHAEKIAAAKSVDALAKCETAIQAAVEDDKISQDEFLMLRTMIVERQDSM